MPTGVADIFRAFALRERRPRSGGIVATPKIYRDHWDNRLLALRASAFSAPQRYLPFFRSCELSTLDRQPPLSSFPATLTQKQGGTPKEFQNEFQSL